MNIMQYESNYQLCAEAYHRLTTWVASSSQTQVARHLGVTRQAVHKLLRQGVSATTAARILAAREMEVRHDS